MVRAHAVGADLSAFHLFSSYSNPTIQTSAEGLTEKTPVVSRDFSSLPRYQAPRSILERNFAHTHLSEAQLKIDAMGQAFSESAKDGSALMLFMGAGALLRNAKLGASMAEGIFAGFANMSARTRLAAGTLATLTLAGCDSQDYGYIRSGNKPDAGTPDAGTMDGGSVDGGSDASINHPPILEVMDEISNQPVTSIVGKEGENINIILRGHDEDINDVLTYGMETLGNFPTGSTIDTYNDQTGSYAVFHWKPDYQQAGSYSLRFKVEDAQGASAYKDVQITVANVIPDTDGDGWTDDKDCAPYDPKKFRLHDDPNF